MFSSAIRYNPAAGQYYENRSKAFRQLGKFKSARQDLICVLILDPNNKEVKSLSHSSDTQTKTISVVSEHFIELD